MRATGTRKEAWKVEGLFCAGKMGATIGLLNALGVDRGPDTVDGKPSYERFIFDRRRLLQAELWRSLGGDEAFEGATEYARRLCRKRSLCLSQVLLRRYLPSERRAHPDHFDSQARATMVVALNDSTFYDGGYYYLSDDGATRHFVELNAGEAFVHAFDLRHGVEVTRGTRYSLVLWFKTLKSLKSGRTPWHDRRAAMGDPDAAYMVASATAKAAAASSRLSSSPVSKNNVEEELEEKELYDRAASLGSGDALLNRGVIASRARDFEKAVACFRMAAKRGKATAMRYLAAAYASGNCGGGPHDDAAAADKWLRRAADCGDAAAMRAVARLDDDRTLLRRAADLGHPDACLDLVHDSLQTRIPPTDDPTVVTLALKRAVANGADTVRTHLLLGRLYAGEAPAVLASDLTEALRCFALVLSSSPSNLDAAHRLTALYCGGYTSQATRPPPLLLFGLPLKKRLLFHHSDERTNEPCTVSSRGNKINKMS